MNTEIYAFTQDNNPLLLLMYGLLVLCGLGFVGYGLFFMPGKYCELDGRPTQVKKLPVGFRIMMQGFPVLVGIGCIVAGMLNGIASGKYYYGFHKGEVLTVQGGVENVKVQTQEDGNADIWFTVDGETFSVDFSEDLAKCIDGADQVAVQYGYHKDEKLIYYIHSEP